MKFEVFQRSLDSSSSKICELDWIGSIIGSERYIEFLSLVSYLFITLWTIVMFSGDISMFRTDRECWSDGDIRKLIIFDHSTNEPFTLFCFELFSHVEMENSSARILALELILTLERLEGIICIVHWNLT